MSSNLPAVAVTGYLAEAACALVIAIVLVSFHRHYHREYLRTWSWSWWAFACFLSAAAAAHLSFVRSRPAASWLPLGVSLISLAAGYSQIGWLLLGTYEVATGRPAPRLGRRGAAPRAGGQPADPPRVPGAGDDGNRHGDLAARGGELACFPGFRADRPPRLLRHLDRARQPQPLPRAPAAGDGARRRH